jgi:proteasome assembly chaperone 3
MFSDPLDDDIPASDLLPMSHLTATTVLGGRASDANTYGELLATQIASALKTKSPEEIRMVVFGLGVSTSGNDRAAFMDLVGLALHVL